MTCDIAFDPSINDIGFKQNVNSLCRNLFTDFLQFYRRRKSVQVFLHIKKVEMYGIEIPISTYRTQGAITFKVLSLKHTEISASRYFLCYKKPLKLKLNPA